MRVPPVRLLGFLLPLLLLPVFAVDAGWKIGVDLVAEAGAGLNNSAGNGRSLQSLALARAEWTPPTNTSSSLRLRTYLSVLSLAGHGPTNHFLGDFLAASNIEGYASTRLYATWLEAQFGEWSLRGGALLADEEFAGTEAGGNLFNSAFGWPAFISANTVNTGPAFFVAAPGLRLERRLGESAALRVGVYDGDTFDSPAGEPRVNQHGFRYRLTDDQGCFVIGEINTTPGASAVRFKAGAWLHTASFADVRDDASGHPFAVTGAAARDHSSNYGAYAVAERTLAGKSGEAGYVSAFVRAGLAPSDRNTLSWAVDTGLACTGLLPGRPTDVAAIGLARAAFSPRFAANARATNPTVPEPDFEEVIEVNYTAALSDHFALQPDVQFIRHPGGSSAQRDAVAFLLRLKASY